ncbi:DUF1492 domain-containing protein [Sutcliffiella horikoshii]|uniref:DUF1492 domain-containing protein n=1 Tax=Sutcliffiella horikoshii TaxID=79883 RepID=UPI003CEAC3C9
MTMNSKEYLSQAMWLDKMIDNKLEQLDSLKALSLKVNSTLSEVKVSGGHHENSSMESAVVKVIDLGNEINDDIDRLVDLKKEIAEVIHQVNNINYQLLLEMRYISGKTWDDVAIALNYNSRSVFKVHGRALKEIEKIREEGSIGQ